jgi:hypothetical protein
VFQFSRNLPSGISGVSVGLKTLLIEMFILVRYNACCRVEVKVNRVGEEKFCLSVTKRVLFLRVKTQNTNA